MSPVGDPEEFHTAEHHHIPSLGLFLLSITDPVLARSAKIAPVQDLMVADGRHCIQPKQSIGSGLYGIQLSPFHADNSLNSCALVKLHNLL